MNAYNAIVEIDGKLMKMRILSPYTPKQVLEGCKLRFLTEEVQVEEITEEDKSKF